MYLAKPVSLVCLAIASSVCAGQQLPPDQAAAETNTFLRAKGVNAYGLRIPRTFAMNEGVHGNDEQIEFKYVALYQQLVQLVLEEVGK